MSLALKRFQHTALMISLKLYPKGYEKGSVIITTNKSFEAWGEIFADNILASAIIDRIVHYSTIIHINGPSYRTKDIKKKGGEAK